MSEPLQALHRFSRTSYEAMIKTGVFHPNERVELVEGRILQLTPQSSRHATVVQLVAARLRQAYREGYDVRVQLPLALKEDSEPEPDVAVVAGEPLDYLSAHPTTAVLVVEVADTSLEFDRGEKRMLYASGAIPEYWVVNLRSAEIEKHSNPGEGGFESLEILRSGESLPCNSEPPSVLEVSELLPPGW